MSSFAATVGGARRNASQTVFSKGTDTDGTDGPAGGREGWWDGAKAESIPLPSYHDGIMIVRQKKHSVYLPPSLRPFRFTADSSPLRGPRRPLPRRKLVRGNPFFAEGYAHTRGSTSKDKGSGGRANAPLPRSFSQKRVLKGICRDPQRYALPGSFRGSQYADVGLMEHTVRLMRSTHHSRINHLHPYDLLPPATDHSRICRTRNSFL